MVTRYDMLCAHLRWVTVRIVLLLLCLVSGPLYAEALVLIHGYLGNGDIWRVAGITDVLKDAGWRDGGRLRFETGNIRVRDIGHPFNQRSNDRRFYTVDLPAEAPLQVQARKLTDYLRVIQGPQSGDIILVGHSAGGLVARLAMVEHPELPVIALITIASPHLGTDTAELGLLASASPLGFLAPLMGVDILNRSSRLFADMVRERPGSLLYWLNRQRHPNAIYISVVRENASIALGEFIVPAYSQDLTHVPALRGKTETVTVVGDHGLSADDGHLLVKLLKRIGRR
jgi:pimeloyl-ACP methyl ester carboxylesterase